MHVNLDRNPAEIFILPPAGISPIKNPGLAAGHSRVKSTGSMADPTEVELLSRVAQGDREAFGCFYDRLSGVLFALAMRVVRDETAAEEVLQDAFVEMWKRAGSYNPNLSKPLTWAVMITRSRALDRVRAKARAQKLLETVTQEFETDPDFGETAEDLLIDSETAENVRHALSRLPAEQRQSIDLAFFGGLSHSEIAERLEVPLGTVKARIRRGMIQLREMIAAPV